MSYFEYAPFLAQGLHELDTVIMMYTISVHSHIDTPEAAPGWRQSLISSTIALLRVMSHAEPNWFNAHQVVNAACGLMDILLVASYTERRRRD